MTILNLIFLNFFIILISYLFGSIPSGYVLTKYFSKIDITKEGSKNIGATNVLRSGSKRLAIFTLLLDALKGIIPIIIFYNSTFSLILAGLSSFIGVLQIVPSKSNPNPVLGVAVSCGCCITPLIDITNCAGLVIFAFCPFV